jgi:hypothetical protein
VLSGRARWGEWVGRTCHSQALGFEEKACTMGLRPACLTVGSTWLKVFVSHLGRYISLLGLLKHSATFWKVKQQTYCLPILESSGLISRCEQGGLLCGL